MNAATTNGGWGQETADARRLRPRRSGAKGGDTPAAFWGRNHRASVGGRGRISVDLFWLRFWFGLGEQIPSRADGTWGGRVGPTLDQLGQAAVHPPREPPKRSGFRPHQRLAIVLPATRAVVPEIASHGAVRRRSPGSCPRICSLFDASGARWFSHPPDRVDTLYTSDTRRRFRFTGADCGNFAEKGEMGRRFPPLGLACLL